MPQPTPYARGYSFTGFQRVNPTEPLPGDKVDLELDTLVDVLAETHANMALLQRDDGELANESVGFEQLKAEVSVGVQPAVLWETATDFVIGDTVFVGSELYRCLVSHTSGVFADDLAADKWVFVSDFAATIAPEWADILGMPAAIDAIDGLTPAADRVAYYTGASAAALATLTSYGRTLIGLADAAALAAQVDSFFLTPTEGDAAYQPLDSDLTSWAGVTRAAGFDTFAATPTLANLGSLLTNEAAGLITFMTTPTSANLAALVTDDLFSLSDAELGAIAGLTSAADSAPYFTGSGTAALMTVTSAARTVLDDTTVGAMLTTLGGQPLDATLTALAAYNTNGLLTQTAADTFVGRTLTGTANQLTVANGDGVSGNPTISLPADVLIPTVLTVPNTGLHILDTNASHDLIIAAGSNITADRTLTVTTGDADRTLTVSGNATVSQDYSTTGNPQFATIELGAASDTTLARSSAGNMSIEGNVVYRAGGTDVPVADGGIGVSSLTAYAVMCGGTTGTGAVQSVASVGTAGQLLKSAGAGALPAFADNIATITFVIDGGGSTITTGVKGYLEIPFACTINRATALADQSGSIVVDIWKDTYANYPPVDADSITASAPVTISSATKSQDSTLTGWTTSIAAGDILGFNVDSITTCQRVTISLRVLKT